MNGMFFKWKRAPVFPHEGLGQLVLVESVQGGQLLDVPQLGRRVGLVVDGEALLQVPPLLRERGLS